MSVLKQKRTVSKAEYLNTANEIFVQTLSFLTRMSTRYARLLAEPVAALAGEVMDLTEKANSIYPSDPERKALRKAHLLEARASLMALDVRLTHCYIILSQNTQGCFSDCKGQAAPKGPAGKKTKGISAEEAVLRLDKMAQKLGELIDQENELIGKVIESDKKRK
ncbi:MAG: hypothetical protein RSB55_03735 [Oscillospiraceae bacterium]